MTSKHEDFVVQMHPNMDKDSIPLPARSDSCFLISSSMASGDSGRATDPPCASLDVVIGGTYLENDENFFE